MYVGCARRGLVASAPAPTGYFSAPLSGLEHEGVGLRLARRPSGPKRRRARAVSTRPAIPRANIRRKQARSSPDRGASNLAGGRWRGCDKPPARVSHGHPAPGARAPRTPLAARTRPHTSIGRHLQRWGQPAAHRGAGESSTSRSAGVPAEIQPGLRHNLSSSCTADTPLPHDVLRVDPIVKTTPDRPLARRTRGERGTWDARAGSGRYVGCARRELAASAAALTGYAPMRPCRGLIYLVSSGCWRAGL